MSDEKNLRSEAPRPVGDYVYVRSEEWEQLRAEVLSARRGSAEAPAVTPDSVNVFAGIDPKSPESHLRSVLWDVLGGMGAESVESAAQRVVNERNVARVQLAARPWICEHEDCDQAPSALCVAHVFDTETTEIRDDGALVRRDRWESAVRSIATIIGWVSKSFETGEVVEEVRRIVEQRRERASQDSGPLSPSGEQTTEGGTSMRAAGEKPDPVGHKGMAGTRSEEPNHEGDAGMQVGSGTAAPVARSTSDFSDSRLLADQAVESATSPAPNASPASDVHRLRCRIVSLEAVLRECLSEWEDETYPGASTNAIRRAVLILTDPSAKATDSVSADKEKTT